MDQHFLNSSFRESLIEHLFIGEMLKISWKKGDCSLEVAKPEVDNRGYDLIMEENGNVRHIQIKTSHQKARASSQKVHIALAEKPSGCVLWIFFDELTLDLGPFLFFGNPAGQKLPDLQDFRVAKHTKGDADGNKAERPAHRIVNKGKFRILGRVEEVYAQLFNTN